MIRSLHSFDMKQKRVLMRVDFNVPIENDRVVDSFRIQSAIPSIKECLDSGSSIVGLATTSSSSDPVGRFSWGRLAGFTRGSSPVSIAVTGNTVDVGLTTFPTIQRRGTGIRDTGALPKSI